MIASKDRTGSMYERAIISGLESVGIGAYDGDSGWRNPSPREKIIIDGLNIQPDVVVYKNGQVTHIYYVTHWSNSRSSQYKFWRTFEELCEQKVSIGNSVISVNCIFEALPASNSVVFCEGAKDLPRDPHREGYPIALEGWHPANGWMMVEAFDAAIVFPRGYSIPPVGSILSWASQSIESKPKNAIYPVWEILRSKSKSIKQLESFSVHSRYRIGLLHLFIAREVFERITNRSISPYLMADALTLVSRDSDLMKSAVFVDSNSEEWFLFLSALSDIPVRFGGNRQNMLDISTIRHGKNSASKVKLNQDLKRFCVDFITNGTSGDEVDCAIEKVFHRFLATWGIKGSLKDLSSVDSPRQKYVWTLDYFANDSRVPFESKILEILNPSSDELKESLYESRWPLEIYLLACNLNTTHDIANELKTIYEEQWGSIRPICPFGGHGELLVYLMQGRPLEPSKNSGITSAQAIQRLASVLARVLAQYEPIVDADSVINAYRDLRSQKIVSANLNGFVSMCECLLGSSVKFRHLGELGSPSMGTYLKESSRILWGANALSTYLDAESNSGLWRIKIQSSQDGNEKHKVKELSGRRRAALVQSIEGTHKEPLSLIEFNFKERKDGHLYALILDGDWSPWMIENLYHAGWDWVGDVNKLPNLLSKLDGC